MTSAENEPYTMTKQELLREIQNLPEDAEIYFGNGDLSFQRLKSRGNRLYQFEFDQLYKVAE